MSLTSSAAIILRQIFSDHTVICLGGPYADIFAQVPTIPRRRRNPTCHISQSTYGGKATNASIGLARLGVKPILLGVRGDDLQGDSLIKVLRQEGVDVSVLDCDPIHPTVSVVVIVQDNAKYGLIVNDGAIANFSAAEM